MKFLRQNHIRKYEETQKSEEFVSSLKFFEKPAIHDLQYLYVG